MQLGETFIYFFRLMKSSLKLFIENTWLRYLFLSNELSREMQTSCMPLARLLIVWLCMVLT